MIVFAYVLIFIAVVIVVQWLASLALAARSRSRAVNRRLTLMQSGMSTEDVYSKLVRKPVGGRLADAAPNLYNRIATYCRQSGLPVTPLRLVAIVAIAAVALWGASWMFLTVVGRTGAALNLMVSLAGAVLLAVTGAMLTVTMARTRRLAKLEEQLPIALDIIARAIRAGHPVIAAVQLAAAEMGDPIGSEFGLIVDETTYGLEFREALLNLATRTGSPDAHYFAVCVGIQAQTGGNLAEVLGNLCAVIRSRQTLKLRVKALASEGKASAMVLTGLPILVVSMFMLTSPTFYTSKFGDPIFWPWVFGIVSLYILGQIITQRIVNFKY